MEVIAVSAASICWHIGRDLELVTFSLCLALLTDRVLGEPKRWHPLVGFGWLAQQIETKLNHAGQTPVQQRLRGTLAWCVLVLPLPILLTCLNNNIASLLLHVILVYLCLGYRSLYEHGMQVYRPLINGNLSEARKYTGYLVSRDTQSLDEPAMVRATVESMLENGHDAVIATLFWYCVGGAPLAVAHRLVNTLDAMWGYKNSNYQYFGFFSAKMDDFMGWPSAKLTACLYGLQGNVWRSLSNACGQGRQYKSVNGGYVMASGATALKIRLGGISTYFNETHKSSALGLGEPPKVQDIPRSLSLVRNSCLLWLFFCAAIEGAYYAASRW